jgi:hypothetical protein
VEGAVDAYRSGKVRADKFLAALVGISNMREAIDLGVLAGTAGPQWRFIGVSGAGAGAPSIVEHSSLILESDLHPDLIVLGIAPLQMLDTLIGANAAEPEGAAAPEIPVQQRAREAIKSSMWPLARRRDVAVSTERALLDLRRRLFETFRVELETVDTRSPWRAMLRVMGSERYSTKVLMGNLEWAQSVGTFDARAYREGSLAAEQIGTTIRRFQDGGTTVLVILTPEHSWLRSREPEGVARYIQTRLRQTSGNPDLQLVDYRAALTDDEFVDLSHINSTGSRRFSRLLGKDLANLRLDGPPLMARR